MQCDVVMCVMDKLGSVSGLEEMATVTERTGGAAVELLLYSARFDPDYGCWLYGISCILPVTMWVYSGCSGFLPHSNAVHVRRLIWLWLDIADCPLCVYVCVE